MVTAIHIRLEDQNTINKEDNNRNKPKPCYNTQKYNISILNWGQIRILFPIQFCGLAVLFLPSHFIDFHIEIVHQRIIIAELICLYYVGILIPLYILLRKKAIRAYFWMLILALWSEILNLFYC